MKRIVTIILAAVLGLMNLSAEVSTRKERQAIVAGNEAYKAKNYSAALAQYKIALRENPASLAALFNKALSQLQMATAMDPAKSKDKEALMQEVKQGFTSVLQHTSDNPVLASRANYNLGNMSFAEQDYQSAIDFYKQALRLNPGDDRARRNLRIAQLKLPKDKKDDKKDNKDNKDNKDQKDKKEQKPQQQPQQDQDKKDDKKEQNPQQQQNHQQPQQRQQGMSQQAADRILKHSSDKEKETLRKAMYGKEKHQQSSRRRW